MNGDLTGLEIDILEFLLIDGANSPQMIAEAVGGHRNSVSRSLGSLEDKELVRNKGTGVWTLTTYGIRLVRELDRE